MNYNEDTQQQQRSVSGTPSTTMIANQVPDVGTSAPNAAAAASGADDNDDNEPKFIDTINPLMRFSNADLAAMNQEFDQFFESDTSSDDEPVDIGKLFCYNNFHK